MYYQLLIDERAGAVTYAALGWQDDGFGTWELIAMGNVTMLDPQETFVVDAELTFYPEGGAPLLGGSIGFDITFNGPAKLKVKNEELESAKITTLGVRTVGSADGFTQFRRAGKVTLTRVPEDKLPFDPTPVLAATAPDADPLPQPAWRAVVVQPTRGDAEPSDPPAGDPAMPTAPVVVAER